MLSRLSPSMAGSEVTKGCSERKGVTPQPEPKVFAGLSILKIFIIQQVFKVILFYGKVAR